MRRLAWTLLICASCTSDRKAQPDAAADGPPDGPPARCDVTKPFGPPTPIAGVNTAAEETLGWLSTDGLRLYFARAPSTGTARDLYVATRPTRMDAFLPATAISELNTADFDQDPKLTPDELTIFFVRGLPGDVFTATRPDLQSPFGTAVAVPALSSSDYESAPWITQDGLTLYLCSSRSNGGNNFDLFRSTRASVGASFGAPVPITELLTAAVEAAPVVRADQLEIFFATNRDGVVTPAGQPNNIWRAERADASAPFDAPAVVAELSDAAANDGPGWVSPDGCELIFSSDRPGGMGGGYDLWFASRPPP